MELIQQIEQKEKELNESKEQYNKQIEEEKQKILKSKLTGMQKSLYLLSFEFESSCSRTPQYLEFHRVFKQEFKKLLKPYTTSILIHKPNHFDISGFFKLKDGRIYYFSIGDLRWSKDSLLIGTAEHFKDYTGGSNTFIGLNDNFAENLLKYLGVR